MAETQALRRPVDAFRRTQQEGLSRMNALAFPDVWLLITWLALLAIGIVAVTTASMPEAIADQQPVYYYIEHQAIYIFTGALLAIGCFGISVSRWKALSPLLLVIAGLLVVLVHVPGVGVRVNGAMRWLNLVVVKFQVGEWVKLAIVLYTAMLLDNQQRSLDRSWRPMIILIVICGLFAISLLLQPDFGTTAVLGMLVFGIMYLAGVNLRRFWFLVILTAIILSWVLFEASYRRARLSVFLDPWADKFGSGYQLVQSLIAVGNGGLSGLGLGQSIQKHQFLPEAHTDFIFAIIAEETGLLGCLSIIALYALLVWRIFITALIADRVRRRFAALVAYGVGLWIALQALINIGVTTGALPTKGLTLPFISYGGSSIVIMMMAMGIVCRIDAESRYQARREGKL